MIVVIVALDIVAEVVVSAELRPRPRG